MSEPPDDRRDGVHADDEPDAPALVIEETTLADGRRVARYRHDRPDGDVDVA